MAARKPSKATLKGPIVIDANVVFAAMIRDGGTREVILDRGLDLRTPPWLWEEVAARYEWLINKTRLPHAALDELLRQIRDRITDIPEAAIQAKKDAALKRVPASGKKDAPYVAAVLAVGGVLWTHDTRLASESKVPVVTTVDLLALLDERRGHR